MLGGPRGTVTVALGPRDSVSEQIARLREGGGRPPPQLREFDSILLAAGSWPELKMFFTPDLMPLELRGFWGKTDTIHGLFVSLAAASRTSSLISFSVGLPWAFIASL